MMDFIVVFALIGHHMMKVIFVLVVKRPTAPSVYKQNVLVAKKTMNMGYIIFVIHAHSIHQVVRHVMMKALLFVLNAYLIISRIATNQVGHSV